MTTNPRNPPQRKGVVPAVARAARLLDVLAAANEPLALGELAEALGLAKSTVHGLCTTLADVGLVNRFENGTYYLGLRVMDLAHAYLGRTDLTLEFLKIVNSGGAMPEESIVLSVLDGADIVYVACRNGSRLFGFNFRIGMRLPANCAASGKALLSTLPAERITELANARAFHALTRKSITRARTLLTQLDEVRRKGYAIDREETRPGMVCIGAPVFGAARGEAIAAVAVSLPLAVLDARYEALAIATVTRIAAMLSQRLGAQRPESISAAGPGTSRGRHGGRAALGK